MVKDCLKEGEKCWACQMDGREAKGTKTFVGKFKGRRSQLKSAIWEENIKMNVIYMCLNLVGS